jgi:hypothetical protein
VLPSFLVIGAAKSGTTSLLRQACEFLVSLHEDVVRLHGHLGPDFDGWGIA